MSLPLLAVSWRNSGNTFGGGGKESPFMVDGMNRCDGVDGIDDDVVGACCENGVGVDNGIPPTDGGDGTT